VYIVSCDGSALLFIISVVYVKANNSFFDLHALFGALCMSLLFSVDFAVFAGRIFLAKPAI
jgi:hypothetical protein